jgi:hypothetical protein
MRTKKKWTKADYRAWCRKLGCRNVRNGHLKRIQKIGASLGGAVQGPINARSGHMRRVQRIGASLGGKTTGPSPANIARLKAITTPESLKLGGHIAGTMSVENGHLARIRTREVQQRAGRISCHLRYHQDRFNPKCLICLEVLAGEYPPKPVARKRGK